MVIGVRAIFLERAGSILPEKYGAAPEKWTPELTWLNRTRQESSSKSIVENHRRTYIYIHTIRCNGKTTAVVKRNDGKEKKNTEKKIDANSSFSRL